MLTKGFLTEDATLVSSDRQGASTKRRGTGGMISPFASSSHNPTNADITALHSGLGQLNHAEMHQARVKQVEELKSQLPPTPQKYKIYKEPHKMSVSQSM